MTDPFQWIAGMATGLALGAVYVFARNAMVKSCKAENKPSLPAPEPPQWRIVSEGVLALDGTQYEIRHKDGFFAVYHKGKHRIYCYDLFRAKKEVLRQMADLMEMGIEP